MFIKRVDNISIFRDFGERNDVRVEGTLITEDFYGRKQIRKFEALQRRQHLAARWKSKK